MVGVSLDDGGWKVLKPFLANANIPYRMLLGNPPTAQRYGIQNMPDTFSDRPRRKGCRGVYGPG